MSSQKDTAGDDSARPTSSGTPQPVRSAPLVIVSERGRHSDESRRIVRAQAARASAAQSRVTRARNREGRDTIGREAAQSPGFSEASSSVEVPVNVPADAPSHGVTSRPLLTWLVNTTNTTTVSLLQTATTAITTNPVSPGGLTTLLPSPTAVGSMFGSIASIGLNAADPSRLQLPLAMPRGFVALQQRIQISESLAALLSRTSCFDFASPGVEERLNKLLYDLIIGHARAILTPILTSGHPIQGHLRIACTCLTIFQGQRADGALFTEPKYQVGLEAAWSEATLLDQGALTDTKSADASLWAIFIITVTTGTTAEFFHQLLNQLLQDLNLQYWSQVRNTLLNFIYPVSFLDAPCKSFFETLRPLQIGAS